MLRHGDLPQNSGEIFLMDGGIETDMIFNRGIDLPEFASFVLLEQTDGERALAEYFNDSAKVAIDHDTGFVFETPTWRASPEWGAKLGYDGEAIRRVNERAANLMHELAAANGFGDDRYVVSGCIGPRGDGYAPDALMSADEAAEYHALQVSALAEAGADQISAITMNHVGEAAGVALAAAEAGLPSAIAFTVETDGRLPDGTELGDAIKAVDAASPGTVAYFMISCAHPDHFSPALEGDWTQRIGGLRANASRMSHAELDESEVLDDGDPAELAAQYADLRAEFPQLTVLGGCCGTDHRHVGAIARACA